MYPPNSPAFNSKSESRPGHLKHHLLRMWGCEDMEAQSSPVASSSISSVLVPQPWWPSGRPAPSEDSLSFLQASFLPVLPRASTNLHEHCANARESSRGTPDIITAPQLRDTLWSRIKLYNQIRTLHLIEAGIEEPKTSNNSEFDLCAIFNATDLKGSLRDVWTLQQPVFWILFERTYPFPPGWPCPGHSSSLGTEIFDSLRGLVV